LNKIIIYSVFTGLWGSGQRCVCRADGLVTRTGRSRDRGHPAASGRDHRCRDHDVAGEPARAFSVRGIARVRIDFDL